MVTPFTKLIPRKSKYEIKRVFPMSYNFFVFSFSTGKVLLEIKFPCKQITSAAFGGPNLDIMYVTTSSRFGEPDPAGTTYKVTGLGAKGLPMSKIQI